MDKALELEAGPSSPDLKPRAPFTSPNPDPPPSHSSTHIGLSSTHVVDDTKTSSEGWTKLLRIVRQYDESKIGDCKEDMDALLVVTGLFSAIVGAFGLEEYKSLRQDPADVTV
ncbi:hypothetical protein BXZ70DRAFT_680683 [Cristinia sonorae]|uniref:DUF6535 domain-containing protein n=1 Tax=Cristinia sonorae TaxID=1940300 RepID=A0A8K0XSJ8_9AGAR|nr:hypothetical protein BXZ70DRAFT_680683 [Cristinia sonorae]